ncbi:ABC transporter ATP-binding protein [Marinospirillum insulare]|uniref:ABC transporter permease n=1 Tax=Marinospirillum insulare TaxID=217169 RepID=A0ABQ5ZTG8_9GAMM|nr:ABC transporter ATP-binding protein [Marinospirillum insulare]GLR62717.1 ABC transporter permease [Marinospirillum insulare]
MTATTNNEAQQFLGVFRYTRRAIELVWQTSRRLTLGLVLLTLVVGSLPAVAAYLGKLIVDAVLMAMQVYQTTGLVEYQPLLNYVLLEALILTCLSAAQRATTAHQALLRGLLGQKVNVMILEKAQTLALAQFEDSEFYDKLTRARREASTRPLALVNKTFSLLQNGIALASFSFLLIQFSPWVMLLLFVGALPVFIAETKFSGDAFQIFRFRSQETRTQIYLETLLAREDTIKEVKLFQLGDLLLGRYKSIFDKLFVENRHLILRRETWGFILGLLGTLTFYAAYAWVIFETVIGKITLGDMTMYLLVFKQGQTAVSASLTSVSGMYEDNLYLSNLYEYLEQPTPTESGQGNTGSQPGDGLRFEQVSFTYPGANKPALENINLHIKPGQSLALVGENGSGKTTLIKLLTRLYDPSTGRILLDGSNLKDWNPQALRQRVGVIFQDFVRYQFLVGENIGIGDISAFEDEERWHKAAKAGMADDFIQRMPEKYHTQLGRWFKGGQELSGGQWQKIALSRAFMREKADILVLDEPTSAMDAEAEAQMFDYFRSHTLNKMAILISHRFSTVRMADQIVLINQGQILEEGNHQELMQLNQRYAQLFNLQASGYR